MYEKKILQHQEGVKHVSTDSLLSAFDMKLAHFEMIINRMRRRVISYTIFFSSFLFIIEISWKCFISLPIFNWREIKTNKTSKLIK